MSQLILIGANPAHLQALLRLGQETGGSSRVTLVHFESHVPCGDMLTGHLTGTYTFGEAFLDLRRLCRSVGACFVEARVTGLDAELGRVKLEGRPSLPFDLISLPRRGSPCCRRVFGARRA